MNKIGSNFNDRRLPSEYQAQEQHGNNGQGRIAIQDQQQRRNPTLFGQSQLKGGFGPVYTIPPFPWQNSTNEAETASPTPPLGQWQSGDSQNLENQHAQHGGNQRPISDIPTTPWQHGGGYHQPNTPYCMRCMAGYQYYQ